MDAAAMKSNQEKIWKNVAPGWKKHDAVFREQTAAVSERLIAALCPGHAVLDIACGVGDPALQAAERVGASGKVVATDICEDMVVFAREKAAERNLGNVKFQRVDGEQLDVPPGSFDAVTMRWGLMFMPDPLECLKGARTALKPTGTIALACWAGPDKNPWASMPMGVLKKHVEMPQPPPGAPGLFNFADPEKLRATLEAAGFTDVKIEPVELTMASFDTGAEFVTFTLETAAPIAMAFSKLSDEKKSEVAAEIGNEAVRIGGGRAHLRGITWVATATNPG